MTLDTDILVAADDLEQAESHLRAAGCERTGTLAVGGSSWRRPEGRSLDVIALDRPWADAALAAPVRGADGVPYAALPHLVLMKLESGRLQDLADVGRMPGHAKDEQIDAVKAMVAQYRPPDVADPESIIRLGKLEHQ